MRERERRGEVCTNNERKKKDGNRRKAEEWKLCVSGRNDRESVAPLRDAAAGKSEVTAAACR